MTDGEDILVNKTRSLLDSVPQHLPPLPDERARIEERMWAAFDAEQKGNSGITAAPEWFDGVTAGGPADSSVTGVSELVRIVKSTPDRPVRRQRLVLQAATVLIVLAAAGLFVLLSRGSGDAVVVGPAAPPTTTVVLGDVELRFPTPPGATVTTLSEQLAVVSLTAEAVPEFDGDLTSEFVVIARPRTLFNGQAAAEFFAEYEIFARPHIIELDETVDSESWSLALDRSIAAELGCVESEPCITFAEFGDGTAPLALEVGAMNDVDVIRGPAEEVVVIFAFTNSQIPNRNPIIGDLTADFG